LDRADRDRTVGSGSVSMAFTLTSRHFAVRLALLRAGNEFGRGVTSVFRALVADRAADRVAVVRRGRPLG
jgi:hypothetical protein